MVWAGRDAIEYRLSVYLSVYLSIYLSIYDVNNPKNAIFDLLYLRGIFSYSL